MLRAKKILATLQHLANLSHLALTSVEAFNLYAATGSLVDVILQASPGLLLGCWFAGEILAHYFALLLLPHD